MSSVQLPLPPHAGCQCKNIKKYKLGLRCAKLISSFGLAWYGLVWIGMAWFGLVWLGIVWRGLVGLGWALVWLDVHERLNYQVSLLTLGGWVGGGN